MITKEEFLKQVKTQIYPLIDKKRDAKVFRVCMTGSIFIFFSLLCLLIYLHVSYSAPDKETLNNRIFGFIVGPLGISVLISCVVWRAYVRYTKRSLRPIIFKILNATHIREKEIQGLSIRQLQKMFFLPRYYWRDIDKVQNDSLGLMDEKVPFYIQEVSFARGWLKRETFQGPVARFFLPKETNLSLMVLKKEALLSKDAAVLSTKEGINDLLKSQGWQILSSKNTKFSADYFVFTNDMAEARRVMTPRFLEQIKELEDIYEAPINFLFDKGQLILAIKTDKDMFEFFTEARMIQTYAKFYDEIAALDQFQKSFKLK